jgi:hypothetical protein
VVKRDPAMRKAAAAVGSPAPPASALARPNERKLTVSPAALNALKALSNATGTPTRDLASEAVALLLLERVEPVPPALRREVKARIHGLD